ncbi:molecular chaperone [Salmonella enterica]|uniref:fimbrial biogenesis chaperone n=1 Tax=Enterobacteriaceae TaxID=543 RepID=UPI0013FE2C37|nr:MULTISPECIES: molecular chaperone [Enterobacteriaceae]EGX8131268.1 molecular chaperone [Salmonella enterica subsp. enterica serovar Mbandaka]EKL9208166.1 molecular chaperone [Salmonella enterica]ELC5607148.1 molecular chaperone [Salmonella enterica]ELD2860044.1 molecular chaperone [Salmonella enterica]ELU8353514.1 molecular chaperone [Salmonella enterica]
MKRIILGGLFALTGGCFCAGSYAASLQMYPLTVNFCNGEAVEPVYVKNTGSEPIGAQLRLYQWQQRNHKDILTPTQALISSPPIASIPPGKEQLVRVITPGAVPAGGNEQSYRLLIDELPGAQAKSQDSRVHFLLRYSVPVFMSCASKKVDLTTLHASQNNSGGHQQLVIRNTGSQHLKLSNVSLVAGGKSYILNKGLLGYVLPGSEMAWDIPDNLPAGTAINATLNDNASSQAITLTR